MTALDQLQVFKSMNASPHARLETSALLGEGMSFKDMRLRALHATPVELKNFGRGDAVEVDA